jgi:hypothetical protein
LRLAGASSAIGRGPSIPDENKHVRNPDERKISEKYRRLKKPLLSRPQQGGRDLAGGLEQQAFEQSQPVHATVFLVDGPFGMRHHAQDIARFIDDPGDIAR